MREKRSYLHGKFITSVCLLLTFDRERFKKLTSLLYFEKHFARFSTPELSATQAWMLPERCTIQTCVY